MHQEQALVRKPGAQHVVTAKERGCSACRVQARARVPISTRGVHPTGQVPWSPDTQLGAPSRQRHSAAGVLLAQHMLVLPTLVSASMSNVRQSSSIVRSPAATNSRSRSSHTCSSDREKLLQQQHMTGARNHASSSSSLDTSHPSVACPVLVLTLSRACWGVRPSAASVATLSLTANW